jgi:mRNA interferase HigB
MMRVISNKALVDFAAKHTDAGLSLQSWRKVVESRGFQNFAEIKATLGATDKVGDFFVFNIGGDKFRIIASVSFSHQKLYVRHVFTHKEYDKWKP